MWVTAYLDLPADTHVRGADFWAAVSGWRLGEPRGRHGEFRTFEPPSGDSCLKAQRIGEGGPRVHVDLHVDDLRAAADQAREVGAEVLDDAHVDEGYVALRSPGGLVHCVVSQKRSVVPPAADWGGHTSRVHSVVLDLPDPGFIADCAYWPAITGTRLRTFDGIDDYAVLAGDDEPLRVLLQRLGSGAPRVHLDVAASDRAAEVRRHLTLGAVVVDPRAHWTVMRDPLGVPYCVTDDH